MVLTKVGRESDTLHIDYYETRLGKQGMLDLTIVDHSDLAKIHDDDTFDIVGLPDCRSGDRVTLVIHHPDHTVEEIQADCA